MPLIITSGYGETGGGGTPTNVVKALSLTAYKRRLVFKMDRSIILDGAATHPTNYPIVVAADGTPGPRGLSVEASGDVLTLYTEAHIANVEYRIELPASGIVSTERYLFVGPFTWRYYATMTASVQFVQAIDARLLQLVFDQPPMDEDALDHLRYSFDPELEPKAASKVTDYTYRLVTSRQVESQTYTIATSGIRGK
jgi:hypothetical protein